MSQRALGASPPVVAGREKQAQTAKKQQSRKELLRGRKWALGTSHSHFVNKKVRGLNIYLRSI